MAERPKYISKFLADDINEVAGGGEGSYGFYLQLALFISIAVLVYHITLDDIIYFYIEGCPHCIELDKKLATMPLDLSITKVNLKDNSKNDWKAKPLYYFGKYILGVKSAPTVYTKHYSYVNVK